MRCDERGERCAVSVAPLSVIVSILNCLQPAGLLAPQSIKCSAGHHLQLSQLLPQSAAIKTKLSL